MEGDKVRHNALLLSTDEHMFRPESEAALRMKSYGLLLGEIHVIVFSTQDKETTKIAGNVWVHSTRSKSRLAALTDAKAIGKTLIVKNHISLIIAQDPFTTGHVGLKLAKKHFCKLAVGIYGTDIYNTKWASESLKHRTYKIIGNKVMKRADAIQSDGPETIDRLRKKYGDKVFFKPMIPQNIGEFSKISRERDPDKLRVLYLPSRLVPQKNLPLFLDVASKTVELLKEKVKFTVVGAGPEKAQLFSEVQSRNLNDFIGYNTQIERDEIIDLYASHDVLVVTSHYEGFPRVFMEAAASGMPIITTKVGGIKGLVLDGSTGYVLKPQADSFAEKIQILAEHRDTLEQFSENIKKTFAERYGDKDVLQYQRVLIDFLTQ